MIVPGTRRYKGSSQRSFHYPVAQTPMDTVSVFQSWAHSSLRVYRSAAAAIGRCNALQIPVVVVTNQAGIGRGCCSFSFATRTRILAASPRPRKLFTPAAEWLY